MSFEIRASGAVAKKKFPVSVADGEDALSENIMSVGQGIMGANSF
jgi:hypothetical protein